jgi:hypothetical protein
MAGRNYYRHHHQHIRQVDCAAIQQQSKFQQVEVEEESGTDWTPGRYETASMVWDSFKQGRQVRRTNDLSKQQPEIHSLRHGSEGRGCKIWTISDLKSRTTPIDPAVPDCVHCGADRIL